ncbi:MAG: DUF427 domain-containing protein [Actinomycetota bacterium]|nr:DUF427 domain-containing protein [Actinomycetota bacterium]
MTLTIGTGPFGDRPAGRFNFDPGAPRRVLYLEDRPGRIRVEFVGETVVDTIRAKMLHESGLTPVYYFPRADVRTDLLAVSDRTTHCPAKGDARYWDISVGDRVAEDAVWSYPDPIDPAAGLAGHLAFVWDAVDAWYHEDERIHVHPIDPYHRVDVRRSSRRVVVRVGDVVVAESRRPLLLFETGLPIRYYLPPEDVRRDVLVPSATVTHCPYKGEATYHHVDVGGERHEDVVWSYRAPLHDAAPVAGHLSFFNERVDLEVDGEPQGRPRTRWS